MHKVTTIKVDDIMELVIDQIPYEIDCFYSRANDLMVASDGPNLPNKVRISFDIDLDWVEVNENESELEDQFRDDDIDYDIAKDEGTLPYPF